MKLVKKSLLALATAAAMAAPAFAAPTNNAGVIWDPNAGYFGLTGSISQFEDGAGVLTGQGSVSSINGSALNCFGCELLISYNFAPTAAATIFSAPTPFIAQRNYFGTVSFWFDTTPDGNTSGDTLWALYSGNFTGTLIGTLLPIPSGQASGSGSLNVIGGAAMAALDFNNPALGGADLSFATSFANVPNFPSVDNSTGNGNFDGAAAVPEPGSLALLGLGLVGLAAARRRKAA